MNKTLVVGVSYGYECATFIRMRELWQFYSNYMDGVEFIFYKADYKAQDGDCLKKDNELDVGVGTGTLPRSTYEKNERWSTEEVQIQKKVFKYALKHIFETYKDREFYYYGCSITSIADLRVIHEICKRTECKKIYAGTIANVPINADGEFFRFVSGAGILMSSDVLQLLLERIDGDRYKDIEIEHDVWVGLLLRDIPRIPLYRKDFTDDSERYATNLEGLQREIEDAMNVGHFHFRAKSKRSNAYKRAEVDPIILLNVILKIIYSKPDISMIIKNINNNMIDQSDMPGGYLNSVFSAKPNAKI